MLKLLCTVSYLYIVVPCHYAECHYGECHYAQCHYAECRHAECHGALKTAVKHFM
jgi:hypothetical protein